MGKNIWFTSDCHFGHGNIIKYERESRPFDSLDEMHEEIICRWNSEVKKDDTVYILGDVFFSGGKELIDNIMPKLNGRKILIRGNHDSNSKVNQMRPYLEAEYNLYNFKYKGKIFVLCHYPMREWMNKEYGSIHLYGHVHSNEHRNGFLSEKNSYHIGMDTNELKPISIEKIIKLMEGNIYE